MDQSDIALMRLLSQRLEGIHCKTPKEIIYWMGAMQAQDYPMAKWAVGMRMDGATDLDIEAALARGEILRTHMLRPTWHFVAAEDIAWLLDLTASQIRTSQNARDRQLGLTEKIYSKSNMVIEKSLSGGIPLGREELISKLQQAGISTHENRSSHLLMRAELEKIICSGATNKGKTTYALFSDRVKKIKEFSKEEALAELARRYFTSRQPASLQDFTWWSGLPAGDARLALELVKSDFDSKPIERRTYWIPRNSSAQKSDLPSVLLIPTYDEFIISYTDRSASISLELEQHMKMISNRGVFWPVLVVNGQVSGIWKRTIKKGAIQIEIQLFRKDEGLPAKLLNQAAARYGKFMGMKAEYQGNSNQ